MKQYAEFSCNDTWASKGVQRITPADADTISMHTADFDYRLPEQFIAQRPLRQRDACRLMVLDRRSGAVEHKTFSDIVEAVRPDDLLVFNDTRVLPARLFCRKASGGKAELLFTERIDPQTWKALAKPGRRLKAGAVFYVMEIQAPVLSRSSALHRKVSGSSA